MGEEQLADIERLFEAARHLPVDDRSAFLRLQCPERPEIRQRVKELLVRYDEPHALLDVSIDMRDAMQRSSDAPVGAGELPATIGEYRILGLLGQGGTGIVYRALQTNPSREVALKVLRPGMHSRQVLNRFRQEVEVLAHFNHPGIARVHESATAQTPHGAVPYLAMELIDGLPLVEYAAHHQLTTRQNVELLVRLCDAVQHAHQKGVIHRDLKPANVIVVEQDGVAQPKVLDFGIARAFGPDFRTMTLQTEVGQVVGTLAYMSPEQATGLPEDVDTRSDVYGLGAIGYQLLSGRLPVDVGHKPLPDAVRAVREQDPVALGSVDRTLRGDLEIIVAKAIEKEKERRYQSAAELGDDLRHFLNDEPIVARRTSAIYQLRKFTKRNKTVVVSACLLFALMSVAIAVSTTLYVRSEARGERLRRALYAQYISLAQNAYDVNDIGRMQELLDLCPVELRGWEWFRLRFLSDNSVLTLRGHTSPVYGLDFSPDGRYLATSAAYPPSWPVSGRDQSVRIWDYRSGAVVSVLRDHEASVNVVKFAEGGRRLISAGGTHRNARDIDDFRIRVWDSAHAQVLHSIDSMTSPIMDIHVDPHRSVYVGSADGRVVRLDWSTGDLVRSYEGNREDVRGIDVSRDRSVIASAGWDGSVRVWNIADGSSVFLSDEEQTEMLDVSLHPNGAEIASAAMDQLIRVWDLSTGALRVTLRGHDGPVTRVAYAPDGTFLVSAGVDQTVRIWDSESGDQRGALRGAHDRLYSLAISPDGELIAAGGNDSAVRLWTTRPTTDTVTLDISGAMVHDVEWSHDGSMLATSAESGEITLWNARTWTSIKQLSNDDVPALAVRFSADGSRVAWCTLDGRVVVTDVATGSMQDSWRADEGALYDLAWYPSGDRIVTCGYRGPTRIWSARSGTGLLTVETCAEGDRCVAMSSDGLTLYGGGSDGMLRAWDGVSGALNTAVAVGEHTLTGIDLTDDDARIAVCDNSGAVTVLNTHSLEVVARFRALNTQCYSIEFSPDGTRLIVSGGDRRVRVFDAATGEHLLALVGHEHLTTDAAFDPSGETIASCSEDQTIRIWPTRRMRASE